MTNGQSLHAPQVSEAVRKRLRLPATSQLGFVVRDTDETARYYEQVFGLGPWSIMDGETTDCTNRGEPTTIRGVVFEYIQYSLGPVPVVFPPLIMKGLSRLGAEAMK